MSLYNFSNITSSYNPVVILTSIDQSLFGGGLLILICIGLAIVTFIMMSRFHPKDALLYTGFFMSVVTGLLWISELIPFHVPLIALFGMFIGVLLSFFT